MYLQASVGVSDLEVVTDAVVRSFFFVGVKVGVDGSLVVSGWGSKEVGVSEGVEGLEVSTVGSQGEGVCAGVEAALVVSTPGSQDDGVRKGVPLEVSDPGNQDLVPIGVGVGCSQSSLLVSGSGSQVDKDPVETVVVELEL